MFPISDQNKFLKLHYYLQGGCRHHPVVADLQHSELKIYIYIWRIEAVARTFEVGGGGGARNRGRKESCEVHPPVESEGMLPQEDFYSEIVSDNYQLSLTNTWVRSLPMIVQSAIIWYYHCRLDSKHISQYTHLGKKSASEDCRSLFGAGGNSAMRQDSSQLACTSSCAAADRPHPLMRSQHSIALACPPH